MAIAVPASRPSLAPVGLVLGAAVLFGSTGTAAALGPGNAPSLAIAASRLVIGGGVLALALAISAEPARVRSSPIGLTLLAGALLAFYQGCYFVAVRDTGVAVATIVAIGSGPVFAGLLGRVLNGRWPGGAWAGATLLAIAGAVCLVAPGGGAAVSPTGLLLASASGAAYASYTVCFKRLLDGGRPSLAVLGTTFGLGGVLMLPVLFLAGTAWMTSGGGLALALYLGLVPTALAYLCFARGLARLPVATVTTLTLAEPVVAASLGVALLSEQLGPTGVAGAMLVLGGLALLAVRPTAA